MFDHLLSKLVRIREFGEPTMNGWIGVDLDGTLAYYDHWRGVSHIGEPIAPMVDRVKQWIKQGKVVKIFTARVSDPAFNVQVIHRWLQDQGIPPLEVTNVKDFHMKELWDDRCVQVGLNTGEPV